MGSDKRLADQRRHLHGLLVHHHLPDDPKCDDASRCTSTAEQALLELVCSYGRPR